MVKNKKGYTIIESVIAMLLVSIIVGGVFASLMASRRAIVEPSYKEDIAYSADEIEGLLRASVSGGAPDGRSGVVDGQSQPLTSSAQGITHQINTYLPQGCVPGTSSFRYVVTDAPYTPQRAGGTSGPVNLPTVNMRRVTITIDCEREQQ